MTVEREFGPDHELKSLYRVYLAIVLVGGFLWWMIPVVAFVMLQWLEIGVIVAISLFMPILIGAAITLYWIPRFHLSIRYFIEDDKIIVAKGVWWKKKSFVHYNRITNLNIDQGPISRHFGLGKLAVQTAGFSGTSSGGGKVAEAELLGIRNFEEVKDVIMEFVKGMKPEAVEAEVEVKPAKEIDQQILAELRKIRKSLEKS